MGDNAWLLIALKNYEEATGTDKYATLIASLENWLIGLNDPVNNGLWGGFEANGDTIHKITEGNIDAFAALDGYTNIHRSILTHLELKNGMTLMAILSHGQPILPTSLPWIATPGVIALSQILTMLRAQPSVNML